MAKSEQNPMDPATVWEPQTDYLTNLYSQGQNLVNTQAPQSQTTLAGAEYGKGYATGPALQNLISSTQGALEGALKPGQNPYLQKAIQSAILPMTEAYKENVLSGITDEAMRAGQMGGSRQGIAEGIAGREYLRGIEDIATKMSFEDYSGGQERALEAMGLAPEVAALGMMPADIMTTIGTAESLAPWQQLLMQQQLVGGPTVLSGGGGGGTGGTASTGLSVNVGGKPTGG